MTFKLNDKVRIKKDILVDEFVKIGFHSDPMSSKMKIIFEVRNVVVNYKFRPDQIGTKISTGNCWFWDWMLEFADGSETRRGHPIARCFMLDKDERAKFGLDKVKVLK